MRSEFKMHLMEKKWKFDLRPPPISFEIENTDSNKVHPRYGRIEKSRLGNSIFISNLVLAAELASSSYAKPRPHVILVSPSEQIES